MRFTPRRRRTALAAALLTLATAAPARAAVEPARSSASFVDSVGVNIHSPYANTTYNDYAKVLQLLRDLGVKHVRDGLISPSAPAALQQRQKAFRQALADSGIRTDLILGGPGGGDPRAFVAAIRDEAGRTLSSVEGANEYDLSRHADWVSELRAHQQALYAAMKADPATAGVKVLGPSLGHGENAPLLGDMGPWVEGASIHAYPGGQAPGSAYFDGIATQASQVSAGEAPIVTETGYHNAIYQYGGHPPTSEAAVGTYMPRLFLEHFSRGVARTYTYELLDPRKDPTKFFAESNFGLYRADATPKPAATSLGNLLRLVDGSRDVVPGSLDYALAGDLANTRRLLLRRADGSFALVLWQTSRVWDAYARRAIGVPARVLGLRLAHPADIAVGRAGSGDTATPVATATQSTDVTLPGDDTVVIIIRPTGATGTGTTNDGRSGTGTTGGTITPPPAPSTSTTTQTATRTVTAQLQQAIANLKRRLGLRASGTPAKKQAAKKQAAKKQAAKKRAAKTRARRSARA